MAAPYRQKLENRATRDDEQRRRGRVAGAGLLAGGAVGFALIPVLGVGAAILGTFVAAAGVAVLVFAGSAQKGTCPSCAAEFSWVGQKPFQPCRTCGEYARIDGGVISKPDPDFVADTPTFLLELAPSETPLLPPICAACGGAATRTLETRVTYDTTWVSIPHCATCTGGADNDVSGVTFRSLALYRGALHARKNALYPRLETSEIENTSTSTPGL